MAMVVDRFDIFLINLDPTRGREIKKTRPCVIISPDEMNHHIRTVIIAPMTTQLREYPTRVPCVFLRKKGHVVLDQIRTVDKERLIKKLGRINEPVQNDVCKILNEMFSP